MNYGTDEPLTWDEEPPEDPPEFLEEPETVTVDGREVPAAYVKRWLTGRLHAEIDRRMGRCVTETCTPKENDQ